MEKIIDFFQSSIAGGITLMVMSALGVVLANSMFAEQYFAFLNYPIGNLSVLLWINDALMAIFFLLVGLEVKREMIDGQLNTNQKRILPGLAAFFGLAVPGIIYVLINGGGGPYVRGWAIPTATDIAFALGVVALLGSQVPTSLKVFLTALAIMDDLMAIVIIALFYSSELSFMYLGLAAVVMGGLYILNKKDVIKPLPYLILGFFLWLFVLKSGIHATLAGVMLAFFVPFKVVKGDTTYRPLEAWEHGLSNYVTFLVVPIFGFANAGVSFGSFALADLAHPIVLGITFGLFLGKQLGIFTLVYSLVKLKLVPMPERASWVQVYGVSLVCGIGFTMSLFVALLAFTEPYMQEYAKIGVFAGSILSGLLGYMVLRFAKEPTV